jgi:putative transposase
MRYPLVRDLAADGIPVSVTCRVLGFSKQAFYRWNRQPVTDRDWDDAHVVNAAIDIHHDDPAFGNRFITDELHQAGMKIGERRVWRLCSQTQLWSVFAKRRGLSRKAGPPVHDDLVDREFTAPATNQVWLTDITEHPTGEGKLYLCAVKDVCSNRIVGYSMGDRMTAALAVSALRNAIALRSPGGTIVHSDRGSRSVPLPRVRADDQAQRTRRLDGPGRRVRRQRCDGIVLLAAAKERPRPETLDDTRRAPHRDHRLDRTHLPPPTPSTRARKTHTHRI